MFSKAKQKQQGGDQSKMPATDTSSKAAAAPASSKRSSSMKAAGVPSIISADMVMRGNISAGGEVQLDGSLEGDIKASTLIVGEKASVKGEIICENVMVRGAVEGGIRAKQVSLAATARILGDILHSSLAVESGAHFEGNCRHSDDPLSEAAANDFRKTRPAGGPAPRPVATSASGDDAKKGAANEAPSFLSQARSPLR